MKGAIETMIGVVVLAFMALLGTAYITASLNTQSAQKYHAAVVTEVEASDFADSVIASCETTARDNEYTNLEIKKMQNVSGNPYAKVTLTYDYTIPILDLLLEHEIVGYAR